MLQFDLHFYEHHVVKIMSRQYVALTCELTFCENVGLAEFSLAYGYPGFLICVPYDLAPVVAS